MYVITYLPKWWSTASWEKKEAAYTAAIRELGDVYGGKSPSEGIFVQVHAPLNDELRLTRRMAAAIEYACIDIRDPLPIEAMTEFDDAPTLRVAVGG